MSQAYGSKEGAAYLIDPLIAPEPSQETGPGSHFYPPDAKVPSSVAKPASPTSPRVPASPSSSTNPYRKSSVSSSGKTGGHSRQTSRDFHHGAVPPYASSSPGGSPKPFPKYREAAFGELNEGRRRSGSGDRTPPNYDQVVGQSSHRRRTSSLSARYPGDDSHKPLDIIRRDSKKAHRSPHLNKRHIPGADTVDRLDSTGPTIPYHHEGPYDAALLARNTDYAISPIAAVANSNREALKATPAEKIKDALERHVPIEGVAMVPPGERDQLGRVYHYEEGTDMMRDPDAPGGPYKQWPGVDYARDDITGKGEPAFSLDKALKAHTIHERDFDGHRGIEMSDRPLMSNYDARDQAEGKRVDQRDPVEIAGGSSRYAELDHELDVAQHSSSHHGKQPSVGQHMSRTSSLRKAGEGLKKRLSIKQKFREIHDGEVPE
ncbi:hypothetical protein AAFC00_000437 [Neodothiora populina]|uniref:Pal1 cell morphology n=1 Tax=Neodothiora populina TaxID=2781224 RepID=A0ABR3PCW3_9PEZI